MTKVTIPHILIVLFLVLLSVFVKVDSVYASNCVQTSNSDYDITVCLESPSDSSTLSGDTTVTGKYNSFTAHTSGVNFSRLEFFYTPSGGSEAYLNSNFSVTSDSSSSFTFHTAHYVDNSNATLGVRAVLRNSSGTELSSNAATHTVTLNNSVSTAPTNTNTFSIKTANPQGDLVVGINGDGASNETTPINIADLMETWNPNLMLYLGDVYYKGSYTEMVDWYGRTYGQMKSISNPVVGNHEYLGDPGGQIASGYYWYWDNIPQFYSYDSGGWHFIALNTNFSKILTSSNNTSGSFDNNGASGVGRVVDTSKNWRTNQWVNQTVTVGSQVLRIASNTSTTLTLTVAWNPVPNANTAYTINGGEATQEAWLDQDLADNADKCIIAYAHHPRWSIGSHGSESAYDSLWNTLVDNNVTLYLTGHDHSYQRWTAMGAGPTGAATATGVTPFVIGSGGHASTSITGSDSRVQASIGGTPAYGAFKLALNKNKANFEYIKNSDQSVFDSGTIPCKGSGDISGTVTNTDTSQAIAGVTVSYSGTAPSGNVSDSTTSDSNGNFSFSDIPAIDYTLTFTKTNFETKVVTNVAVGGATTTSGSTTMNSTVGGISGTVTDAGTSSAVSGATVSYVGGNTTTDSNGDYSLSDVTAGTYKLTVSKAGYADIHAKVTVTVNNTTTQNFTPAQEYFKDGFESGDFSNWTTNNNLTTQQSTVNTGSYAAEGNTTSVAMNARKTLSSSYSNLYMRSYFNVKSQASGSGLGLVSFRNASDGAIIKTYIDGTTNKLCIRNEVTLTNTCSNTVPTQNTWHSVELHAIINGTSSTHEVWYDGTAVTSLTSTSADLGTSNIGRAVIGEVNSGRTFDVVFDDVSVRNAYIGGILGTVTGTVTDSMTTENVSGATISYSGGSTTSNGNGVYYLVNVPLGVQTITYSKTGYTSSEQSVTVNIDGNVTKNVALVPTTGRISGTLTSSQTSGNLEGVTVSYSGGNTTTDSNGSYTLLTVTPGTYILTASKNGYTSKSAVVTVTAGQVSTQNLALATQIFTDNFESGNFNSWTTNNNMVAQQTDVHFGSYSAEGDTTSAAMNLRKNFGTTYPDLYYRAHFNLISQSAGSSVGLVSFRNSSDGGIIKVYIDGGTDRKLCIRNDVTSTNTCSTTIPSQSAWHSVELYANVNGTSSTHKVWLDGVEITALTSTSADLGSSNIGRIHLGEVNAGRTYDVVFDDVLVQTTQVNPAGGAISGTVTDSQSQVALSGVTVAISGKNTTTDSNGDYTLWDVAPGSHSITADKTNYTQGSGTVLVVANNGTDKDFALVGSNIGTISGTVTDAGTSNPVEGVTVTYSGGNTATNSQGNYTLSGVAAGTYTVTASKSSYTTKVVQNVSVTAGNTTDQDFSLPQLFFSDDFETGDMNNWTTNNNMSVQTTTVHAGSNATEANASGTAENARKSLSSGQSTVFYRAYFNVNSQDTNGLGILSFRDTSDAGVIKTYIDGTTGYLCIRNEVTLTNTCSTTVPSQDAWHTLELQSTINGTSSTHKVWLNGNEVTALTSTSANLGSTNIGKLVIGEVNSGRTHNIFFDDVIAQNSKVD